MSTLPSFDHGHTSGRPAVSATGTHCGQRRPRAHRTRDFHLDLSAQFSIHDQSILELIQYKMIQYKTSLENRSIPTQAGSENHGHTVSLGYLWCPANSSGSERSDFQSGPVGRRAGTRVHAVSYTHLRAHETRHDLVCRLLLE